MIPKLIHYCWFGNGPKNETIRRCMDSWARILPGYVFREWSEKDMDGIQNRYVREAYAAQNGLSFPIGSVCMPFIPRAAFIWIPMWRFENRLTTF